eukprot:TRINITY_DN60475_c0_g1_i1.p1 TRINITY_DN60475_c0_g1~~TRINITY_DN60475_c0_g1_i1.p1  ORF type:complete len:104 (+),score=0.54 TRINITY_DN60475_c0_g1_i1:399-710(+)
MDQNISQPCHAAPGIDWSSMAGLRDILIHQYFGIDLISIWNISQKQAPMAVSFQMIFLSNKWYFLLHFSSKEPWIMKFSQAELKGTINANNQIFTIQNETPLV